MIALPAMVAAASLGFAAPVSLKSKVEIPGRDIRLGDLVANHHALADTTLDMTVARLPAGTRNISLRVTTVAALVRRRVPGLALAPANFALVQVQSTSLAPGRTHAAVCFAAARNIAAGAAIAPDALVSAPCRRGTAPALRYADGVLTARTALTPGAYLGRLAAPAEGAIAPGQPVTIRASAGVVTIERSVTAVQRGRSGQPLFVRDADGRIFAATGSVQ